MTVDRSTKENFEVASNAGANVVLIDARSSLAYQSNHLDVKNAIRIRMGTIAAHLAETPRGLPIFTVCTSAGEGSGAWAAQQLRAAGYDDARPIAGGFNITVDVNHFVVKR